MEGGSDLGVHLDRQAALDHHLLVARLDLRLHPVRKDVLEDGVDDVADPPGWKE